MSDLPAVDQRIYDHGQLLGRLEGQVASLAQSLEREHDERIAAMKAHEQRADATDRRVEQILDRLAEQIGRVGDAVHTDHTEIDNLKERRDNGVSATRWLVGTCITILLASAAMYASSRVTSPANGSCPLTDSTPQPELRR